MFKIPKRTKKEDDSENVMPPVAAPHSDDTWLSTGIDIENRIIELTGIIAEPMYSFLLKSLIKLNTINHNPITIYLSSNGGIVHDGMAIYDLIRSSPSPTIIYAIGKICSMGIIVLIAGDRRFASANTRFMMHSASHATEGKTKDTRNDVNEVEFQDKHTSKLLVSRSNLTKVELDKLLDAPDHWFGTTTARKYGILTTESKPKARKAKRK